MCWRTVPVRRPASTRWRLGLPGPILLPTFVGLNAVKRALVCGAGGFIGGHLVKKLKREGYWVRGVDIKEHEFALTQADEFLLLDLREPGSCEAALMVGGRHGRVRGFSASAGVE